jgi:putative hydrolases of HD superfamily
VAKPTVTEPWTIEKALDALGAGEPENKPESPIPFFHILERLKTTKREGWKRFGIMR